MEYLERRLARHMLDRDIRCLIAPRKRRSKVRSGDRLAFEKLHSANKMTARSARFIFVPWLASSKKPTNVLMGLLISILFELE